MYILKKQLLLAYILTINLEAFFLDEKIPRVAAITIYPK